MGGTKLAQYSTVAVMSVGAYLHFHSKALVSKLSWNTHSGALFTQYLSNFFISFNFLFIQEESHIIVVCLPHCNIIRLRISRKPFYLLFR